MAEDLSEPYPALGETIDARKLQRRGIRNLLAHTAFQTILAGLGIAVVFIVYLSAIQFSTSSLTGVDGYYHIRFASLMRSQGLKPAFPWLPLTILNPREFYDHHFLYHVGLLPFTFGDVLIGAKWSAVFYPGLAFLSIWWLLRSQHIPFSAIWSFGLLAVSEAFIYRMSMVRAQSLSLMLMVVGIHWLLTHRYTLLIPLSFIYVWTYDAFPVILILSAIYVGSVWLIEHRLDFRPLLFTGFGIALGLIINPYVPNDIVFIIRHLLPKLTETTAINVGNEWYPYDTGQLIQNSPLALVAFLAGAIALGLHDRRMDARTSFSLFVAIFFGLMLFQARRFIEYFPPFALIFAAFAWSPLLSKAMTESREQPDTPTIYRISIKSFKIILQRRLIYALALLLIFIPGTFFTFKAAKESMQTAKPNRLFSGASEWLAENTPPGARVFQTDWDDFPYLFFHNTHNTYLVGLDPTYLQLYDPELYDRWVKITNGNIQLPSKDIFERFGSLYVVTDLSHKGFIRQAGNDPHLNEVFRDDNSIVYALIGYSSESK